MSESIRHSWPIFVKDRHGHQIYLTWERWEHALGHPGMDDGLLEFVLETLRKGGRKQDTFDRTKYKYTHSFADAIHPCCGCGKIWLERFAR